MDHSRTRNATVSTPSRRPLRLTGFDYASRGAYFVTLCVQRRRCLFGDVVGEAMHHSAAGRMVEQAWLSLPGVFSGVGLDAFVVMPNHLHGLLVLDGRGGSPSIGHILGRFKTYTLRLYVEGVREHGWPRFDGSLWQRSYYDHVVRDEDDLTRIREYIENNPLGWALDEENPDRVGGR